MRFVLLGVALVGLAGCDALEPAGVRECEDYVIAKLRSPSTYKRISRQVTHINPANPSDIKNPTEVWVTIEYDAANAYGTPIRDRQTCQFPRKGGQADTSNYIDFDGTLAEQLEQEADNLEAAADAAVGDPTPD